MDIYEENAEQVYECMETASVDGTSLVSHYVAQSIEAQSDIPQSVAQVQVEVLSYLQQVDIPNHVLQSAKAQNHISQFTEEQKNVLQSADAQNYVPESTHQQELLPQSAEAQIYVPQFEAQGFAEVQTQGLDSQQVGNEGLPEEILKLIDELPPAFDGHKPGSKQVDGSVEDGRVISVDEGIPWWHKFVIFFLLFLLRITGDHTEEKDLYSLSKKTGRVYIFVPVVVLSVIFLFSMLNMQHLIFPMIVTAVMMGVAYRRFYRPFD